MGDAVDDIVIGPADDADHEVLFEIYRDVVAAGGAQPAGGTAEREVFHEGWIRKRRVYVARAGGVTIGGYFLRTNFPAFAAHIVQGGYLVAESVRRRGVGSRLLTHSLEEAARLGYTAMMFNLVQQNNPSRRLYERAGFRIIGRIPEVHGEEDGLIYWRSLAIRS
jgi:L-amino acid N-acyltransferase YncA